MKSGMNNDKVKQKKERVKNHINEREIERARNWKKERKKKIEKENK